MISAESLKRIQELQPEKPLPEPLYGCYGCSEDYSWPATDLFWSEPLNDWCCDHCWSDIDAHWREEECLAQGISLAEELKQRGFSR
jgi:hypothetical protein